MPFAFSDYGTPVHVQRFGFPRASILPITWSKNIPWKIESRAASSNSPPLIKGNGSLPSPQKPAAILYLHPQLSEYLFKCHPYIYTYVSQVVSFHVYQLKLWTHFPLPNGCDMPCTHRHSWPMTHTHIEKKPLWSTTRHFLPPPINSPSLWPTHYSQHLVLRYPRKFMLFADCLRSRLKPTQNM